MFRSFRGGIRFDLTDNGAKKAVIRHFDESEILYISMEQGGGTCIPAVKKGEEVLRGQLIGTPVSGRGLPVYSSVSGRVEEIKRLPHPFTGESEYVIISDDRRMENYPFEPMSEMDKLSAPEIIELAHRAAIPGPTQYSEPEYVRMQRMVRNGVRNIVCGAVECEPYIGHSTRICAEYAYEVVCGLELMMKAAGADQGYIALISGSIEAERAIKNSILNLRKEGRAFNIRISHVAAKYPAASRLKQMFETKSFNISEKPIPAGVTSPFACMSLYRAAKEGRPVTDAVITVSGSGVSSPNVFEVPVGTPIEDLIRRAVPSDGVKSIIMGNVMSGIALDGWRYPVLRCNTALLAMNEVTEYSRSNECIHCNRCGKVCPMGLSPSQICEYLMQGNIKEAEVLGLRDCRLCGCCTYICPGRMELTEILKEGKNAIWK